MGLASAGTVCECAFVADVLACLSYLAQHRVLLRAPADLSETCPLPLFDALRLAVAAMGVASATPASAPTLPTLLSASPSPAQRALAEGLWDRAYAVVLGLQSAAEERARVCSAAGAHAGDWLCCMPVTYALRAASRHFQLALAMRLGAELHELAEGPVHFCRGCGGGLDRLGRHYQHCGSHNRLSLSTTRHDGLQCGLQLVIRRLRRVVHVVGHQRWFTGAAVAAAGLDPTEGQGLYADLVLPHYRAPGRHLFIDVAVGTPDTVAAMGAVPSSMDQGGVAAQQRADAKHRHYRAAVEAMGARFRAATMERFGACSDDLCALVRELCGEGDRPSSSDDWYFTAPSSVTYHMQHVVLAGVMADAAMVDRAMDADIIHPVDPGRPPRDGWRDVTSAAARRGGRPAARAA